ncbi:LOW QUALITY PROTEIN: uncharacterized protein LOC120446882 [Drosophila santomea]|uniref:LOW QUALITY PROTEIN: uncharacterized protein LOC120446882 n=1 Tax=Drosophila santomea TaxID=129105 RepID=UPI001953A2A1|nr:LOW QUALITY PROTEIN: uncharacterized protein LOC120446882 [Drosophila santomea]
MKLIGFLLCSVAAWQHSANASDVNTEQEQIRTALPWLYLLALTAGRPQIPILRPQDESLAITNSAIMKQPQSDEILNSEQTNNEVREQFLQGILLGLQQPGSATISPAVLSDFIAQATTTTTRKPEVEKDADGGDTDEDVDYIDFKNGSRIKYDLDDAEQTVNKILQRTTSRPAANPPQSTALYYRTPPRYVYYRPIYGSTPYYYRVG